MSLEGAIATLNASVQQLIETIKNPTASVSMEAAPDTAPEKKSKTPEKKTAQKDKPKTEESTATVEYDVVKKAILKLASVNKAAAVEILDSFGAKKGTDLTEDQYGKAVFMLESKLAELAEAEGDE